MKKTASKLTATALALLMLLGVLSVGFAVSAATFSGSAGDSATWEYDTATDTLTISGTGAINGSYMNAYGSMVFEGKNAHECVRSVVIGAGITDIPIEFYGCWYLPEYTVAPNNLNFSSENGVLFNKDKSVLLRYPASASVVTYTVLGGVTEIAAQAFMMSFNLNEVLLPDTLASINHYAFLGCTQLEQILLPDSMQRLGLEVFSECLSLRSLHIPKNLTTIADHKSMADGSLVYLSYTLEEITIAEDNPAYKSVDGVLFNKSGTELIAYPYGSQRDAYKIPDTVADLSYLPFSFIGDDSLPCNLVALVIPPTVASLDLHLGYIGEKCVLYFERDSYAHQYCMEKGITNYVLLEDCPHGFTSGNWETTQTATCTAPGERIKKCTVCDAVLETGTIPATGHTPGQWEITKQPTSTEPGERVKKCTVCKIVLERETIPATGGGVQPPKPNTIFGTKWKATVLNWILFFLCFGWLWMWF